MLHKIWTVISDIGIHKNVNSQLQKKIRISNQVFFSLSVIASCYGFIFYSLGFHREGLAVIFVVASMATPLILNYYRLFFLSRTWFLIAINLAVLIYSNLFGTAAGIQLVYFAFACLPWIIFKLDEGKYIIAGIVLPVIGYFIVSNGNSSAIINITQDTQAIIYKTIVVVVFLILSLTIWFYVYQHHLSEMLLLDTNKTILANKELLRTQNRQLKEVAWMQSHRFRRPVASLLGLVELLNFDNPTDPDNKKTLTYIKNAAEELDVVIREINEKTENS